jgi:hypothetical protein
LTPQHRSPALAAFRAAAAVNRLPSNDVAEFVEVKVDVGDDIWAIAAKAFEHFCVQDGGFFRDQTSTKAIGALVQSLNSQFPPGLNASSMAIADLGRLLKDRCTTKAFLEWARSNYK